MPTVTATLAQALRYFLNGAYLLMLLHWTGSPYAPLISTQRDAVILAAVAIVLGTLAYCVHRAVIYPLIGRSLWWVLADETRKREPGWLFPYWPLRVEAQTALRRQANDKLVPYFSGWSAETHFLYIAIWLTALTFWLSGLLQCGMAVIGGCQ
ncbi:MAG: hypothetical protein ACREM3_09625 [Candidatus Rokuibacteriota bacterium]